MAILSLGNHGGRIEASLEKEKEGREGGERQWDG